MRVAISSATRIADTKMYHMLTAAAALAVVQMPELAQTCERTTRNFNVVQFAAAKVPSICGFPQMTDPAGVHREAR